MRITKGKGSVMNVEPKQVNEGVKGDRGAVVLFWLWKAVRLPLFLVMYWLRLPVVLVCNWVSTPCLLLWLFTWYAFPEKPHMVWGFCFVGFAAFVVAWLYDLVLMALSPEETIRVL